MKFAAGNLFSLGGRTAVLTGASGFLGRTMARTLLDNGARVVLLGGRAERLEPFAAGLSLEYGSDRVRAVPVDMRRLAGLRSALDGVARKEARIDILVNNAHDMTARCGFNSTGGTLEKSDRDQWLDNLIGGVFWPALAVQCLGNALKKWKGSVINVSSMYALVAPAPGLYAGKKFLNPPGYSAAKAGMLAFTRYVASFWGPHGVRCNAILPGPFPNTEFSASNAVGKKDDFLQRLGDRTCLGRVGKPEDLSGALLFLASGASGYVTGHALVVDGGWTIV